MVQRTETHWQDADGEHRAEQTFSPVEAKQGRTGKRILTVLIAALVLAFIVWIPVEIWGEKQSDDAVPQQSGQQMQSEKPALASSPSPRNVNAMPTETPSTPSEANTVPAAPKTPAQ